MSGHLGMSTHQFLPGQPGEYIKLTRKRAGVLIVSFLSVSFINCCSILPGGSTVKTLKAKMSFRVDFLDWTISVFLIAAHLFQPVGISSRVMAQVGWACSV